MIIEERKCNACAYFSIDYADYGVIDELVCNEPNIGNFLANSKNFPFKNGCKRFISKDKSKVEE